MHKNTWGRVPLLVNLMFRRLIFFIFGPIFGVGGGKGTYIRVGGEGLYSGC